MTSHTRTLKRWTLLLASCFFVLASTMAYLIRTDNRETRAFAPKHVDAQTIRIIRNGFDDLELSKVDGQWQLQAPCKLAANEQRLSPLIAALAPGTHQYSASEVDLEAAGLLQPLATVYINGTEHRLGNTDLDGDRRYLQRGDSVELIAEWALSLVNGGITALVQLEVFPTTITQLRIIESDGSNTTLSIDDDALSQWQTIAAQQIVSWPLPDIDPVGSMQLHATQNSEASVRKLDVYKHDSLVALVPEGSQCAYIFATGTLPQF